MEPDELLSDLLEVSGQVEAAAIVTRGGELVAATADADADAAAALADTVQRLSTSASAVASPTDEHLVQLQISLEGSCVFLAQDEQHAIGCVTVAHPTAGLVFYDLKTTLRRLAGEHEDLVPKPRAWDGGEGSTGESTDD